MNKQNESILLLLSQIVARNLTEFFEGVYELVNEKNWSA